jgi:hypothetical protein
VSVRLESLADADAAAADGAGVITAAARAAVMACSSAHELAEAT